MEQILIWDYNAAYFVNQTLANGVFDTFLPLFRNKLFWTPLYVFIISFILINYRLKGLWMIIVMVLMVALADQVSSSVLKPWVGRLRPCNDPDFHFHVRLLLNCRPSFSFPSSHAVNHFAVAFYLITIFIHKWKWIFPILFTWAFLIAFAQVYVGLHFPIDVIFGGLLGILLGVSFGMVPKNLLKIEV